MSPAEAADLLHRQPPAPERDGYDDARRLLARVGVDIETTAAEVAA